MKRFIGKLIGHIGAFIMDHGGWNGEKQYEDFTIFGKLGFHMICVGLWMMGVTKEDIDHVMSL